MAKAYHNLAEVLQEQGKLDDAMNFFQRSVTNSFSLCDGQMVCCRSDRAREVSAIISPKSRQD
jgi:hypothetical protein